MDQEMTRKLIDHFFKTLDDNRELRAHNERLQSENRRILKERETLCSKVELVKEWEVAEALRITVTKLRRNRRNGIGPKPLDIPGIETVYSSKDVANYICQNEEQADQDTNSSKPVNG